MKLTNCVVVGIVAYLLFDANREQPPSPAPLQAEDQAASEPSQPEADDAGELKIGIDAGCPCDSCVCDPCLCGVEHYEFWTASWCGPCQQIKDLADKKWIERYSVDVDKNKELAKDLKIVSAPTLIVYKGDKETERHVGLQPIRKALGSRGLLVKKPTRTDSQGSKSTGKSSTSSTSCRSGNCGTTSQKKSRRSTKSRRTRPGLFGRRR